MRRFAVGISDEWATVAAIGIYPFDTELAPLSVAAQEEDPSRVLIVVVVVGASQGGTMKEIRQAVPQLKGNLIAQDIARVIDHVPASYQPRELDIHLTVHDFWTPQPPTNQFTKAQKTSARIVCQKILQHNIDAIHKS
ncbi:MAG: hypothetical protein ASARMPRED_009227 [Alectoria sarmentosa]|nr:MAG: hypothetical protein ASARMPRED_009227 [Alectoria sarmentosa]